MKKIIFILSFFFSLYCEASGIPVLEYHQVDNSKELGETVISIAKFKEQMQYLNDQGYKTISIKELVDVMNNKTKMIEKTIVITFDDGWTSILNATPILNSFDMKASFLIIGSMQGNQYLTWKQLKDLVSNSNYEVQSHTQTHPWSNIDNLVTWSEGKNDRDENDIMSELIDSKLILERNLGKSVNFLAWPSGYYNQKLIQNAKLAGYEGTLTIEMGTNNPGDDPYKIKRLFIDGNCNIEHFIKILEHNISSLCSK